MKTIQSITRLIGLGAAAAALARAAPAGAQQPLKIGFMAELSGPQGALGQDQYDAFMMVVERNGGKLGGAPVQVLREDSQAVAEMVQEGSSLNRALRESGRFPPMMVHMVASGEASGELENMLERSATNQERELEMTMGTLMSLFEPLMVVFMGGMVLTIVLAILLPIFDLNTMVK